MANEKRLIDADALVAVIRKHGCLDALVRFINNVPTVDAVEVVHGRWITDRFGLERSICSVCDACYEGDGGNYCRNCGAKMDGKEKDSNLLFADMEEIIDGC